MAAHRAFEVQALLERDTAHEDGDRDLLAALQTLHARAAPLGTLEAGELAIVLPDVLGHQDRLAALLDEEGVAGAHQSVDDRPEALAADALVLREQRNQHPAVDRPAALVNAEPRNPAADA